MEAEVETKAAVKNVPALRFPEFEGEWQLRRIGDVCKIKHGFAFKGEYFNTEGPSIVLTPGNFDPEGGFRYQADKEKFFTSTDFPHEYILEEGDLLTVMTEQAVGLIGSALIVPKSGLFLHNQRLGLFQVNYEVKREFLFHYMATASLRTKFSKTAAGTKVRHTSPKRIEGIQIFIPSLVEQERIASFLSAVKDKILQLSKKKELLEQYKKGVMQQIFCQQIRFKDDNGNDFPEWEEKRLGEVSVKKASTISANKIEDNFGEYIMYGASGVLKSVDFYEEENDYISIVKDGAGVGRLLYCKGKSSVLGTLDIIRPKVGIVAYFLYCLLSRIDFTKYTTGSTIPHIYFKDYSIEKVGIPCVEEQGIIANFLTSIDNKINFTDKQLEQARLFKKGLLQQLFV